MKNQKSLVFGLCFVFISTFFSSQATGMANREGVNWRTNDGRAFIFSAFQATIGRNPSENEIARAMRIGTKTGVFWALVGSQEYKNRYNYPRVYNVYRSSKWIRNEVGGISRLCNCYYFAKFAYDHVIDGPYSFDIARAVVLMNNAFDREACPYYDCGYSDFGNGNGEENNDNAPINNLVLDPNFSNFDSSSGPWGRNVLYGKNGIWWNSHNAQSSAKTVNLNGGGTALYIQNNSGFAAHVYGTTAQRIKTVKGQRYQISFSGAAKDLASNSALVLTVDPKWAIRPVSMKSGSYNFRKFTGTFEAKANYIDLRIIMQDRGEVWLKDMTLQKIQ